MREKAIERVKGNRVCHQCHALCAGLSWRSKTGQRRTYFDTEECLRFYLEKQIGHEIGNGNYRKLRNTFYERIIVLPIRQGKEVTRE